MKQLLVILSGLFFVNISYGENSLFPYIKEYQDLLKKKYVLLPHKGTFLLPLSYNDSPNNKVYQNSLPADLVARRGDFNKRIEAEFQISFLTLTNKNIFGSKFSTFIGYTHQSWWQIYNDSWSRQFRETNYSPEVFFRRIVDEPLSFFGGKIIAYDFGLVHQSNGQIQELSRSWNRVFLRFVLAYKNLFLKTSIWYRLPEGDTLDDNPSIHKYKGYGELDLNYKKGESHLRLNLILNTQNLGYELSYSYPWQEGLRYYVKTSQGYGLSLIDYNHNSNKIGLGIILADPFSK